MSFNIKISERKIKMAFDRLIENIVKTQNPSVVGLDPKLDYVPEYIKEKKFKKYGKTLKGAAKAIWEFNKTIIDEIHDICPAIKPQAAYYVSFAFFAIIVPIMQEIVFRGVFLQTFRQFGDTFAIMITAVVNGLCYYDITYLPFVVCCTAVLGLFTIRTGSVFTAISMSICAHITNFVLSYIVLYDLPYAKIAEVIICTVIVGVSLVMYSKLTSFGDWTFNIENDNSFMTMSKRVKSFISTNSIAVWIAAILVTMFVCARII